VKRVAALYDIHGNLPALEAVLREVECEAPDVVVVGGDVAAGPMPCETLDLLLSLDGDVRFIRGNADRELVAHFDGTAGGEDDGPWTRRDAWAAAQLTRAQRDLLARLEPALGLGATLFCHGSPRRDDEPITRVTPAERLDEMLRGTRERLVVCGHTHVQFDRRHGGARIVNAGSVGMHWEGRPGAYWLMLSPAVELRRTPYDIDAAARRMRATGYPGPEEIIARLEADDPSLAVEASLRFEQTAMSG
jgi:predicted phosphodiesterase